MDELVLFELDDIKMFTAVGVLTECLVEVLV